MGIGKIGVVVKRELAVEGVIGLLGGGSGVLRRFCRQGVRAEGNKHSRQREAGGYGVQSHSKTSQK
ncbi:hypothetical protein D3C71_2194120 [compost metagenome]